MVINNTNTNNNNVSARAYASATMAAPVYPGRMINKWIAFLLCLFLGYIGVHKFYEGKIAMGILYLLTFGLFGIGWIVDLIAILLKPNPYYIYR